MQEKVQLLEKQAAELAAKLDKLRLQRKRAQVCVKLLYGSGEPLTCTVVLTLKSVPNLTILPNPSRYPKTSPNRNPTLPRL